MFAILQQVANHYSMRAPGSVKEHAVTPKSVVVIPSLRDLTIATRLRRLPDLFELRLDGLCADLCELEDSVARLRAPLIITARDPREGGLQNLPLSRRRELLFRFLPHAAIVDVELRSAERLAAVLDAARKRGVRRIVSVHDLRTTPPLARVHELATTAEALGADIFKIATRTDTTEQLDRLVTFFYAVKDRMRTSAMGIGALGRTSRRLLAARGSALNYAHLGTQAVKGQLSLADMRRVLAAEPHATTGRTREVPPSRTTE